MDREPPRFGLDTVSIRVTTVTTDEDPDIAPVIQDTLSEMTPEEAARFEELAEEAFARWEDRARQLLADELAAAYREATEGS